MEGDKGGALRSRLRIVGAKSSRSRGFSGERRALFRKQRRSASLVSSLSLAPTLLWLFPLHLRLRLLQLPSLASPIHQSATEQILTPPARAEPPPKPSSGSRALSLSTLSSPYPFSSLPYPLYPFLHARFDVVWYSNTSNRPSFLPP